MRLKGPRPLLEPRTCDWLCEVCANGALLGRAHARAWVQLDQMKRTAPNSAPAVPRTAAEATYARSTRVRRRTCELGVDPCSAALVEAVDVRCSTSDSLRRPPRVAACGGDRTVHGHSLNALLQGGVQRGRRAGAPAAMRAGRINANFFRGCAHVVRHRVRSGIRIYCTGPDGKVCIENEGPPHGCSFALMLKVN